MFSKLNLLKILTLTGLTISALSAYAHHVFSAEYDAEKPVRLTGTLTKIQWVNPHSWIYVDVKDSNGTVSQWTIEFGSPIQLTRRGLKKNDLTIGHAVDIAGFLSKSKADVAIANTVKLIDGREFYVGGEGAGIPEVKPAAESPQKPAAPATK